jgi:hypothetical protein
MLMLLTKLIAPLMYPFRVDHSRLPSAIAPRFDKNLLYKHVAREPTIDSSCAYGLEGGRQLLWTAAAHLLENPKCDTSIKPLNPDPV